MTTPALRGTSPILRKRMDAEVVRLTKHLDEWIDENTCHNEVEITSALLEAAFERLIALLGERDAFDLGAGASLTKPSVDPVHSR
jgi:hypothetical protein